MKTELVPPPVQFEEFPALCLAVVEQSPLPMAMVEGSSRRVQCVNPAFCQLLNKSEAELVGRPFAQLLPEADHCAVLLERVFQTAEPASCTQQENSVPASIFWSYTLWPMLAGDRLLGVMIQLTKASSFHRTTVAMNEALLIGSVKQHELTEAADKINVQLRAEIQERQAAEAALQEARTQLASHAAHLEALVEERTVDLTSTNQQLETLIYTVAHDLRAPLRAMQGFSDLLAAELGSSLSAAAQGHVARISKSAQHLDALLRDLLAFSQVAQHRLELRPIALEGPILTVLAQLEPEIQRRNAVVGHAGPWPAVLAHESTLILVLVNLVSNALKFAWPDRPPCVRLRTEEKAGFVRIWVEDNGTGIAPRHQEQIFHLFTRLHGDKNEGTGVGLAIVQKGLERMGGRVGVESTFGHGSRFWFELRKA
jgi:signal transduction histidine kinase